MLGHSWKARCEAPLASHLRRSCTSTTRPSVLQRLVRHMAPPGHGKPDGFRVPRNHTSFDTGCMTSIHHKGWAWGIPMSLQVLFYVTTCCLGNAYGHVTVLDSRLHGALAAASAVAAGGWGVTRQPQHWARGARAHDDRERAALPAGVH